MKCFSLNSKKEISSHADALGLPTRDFLETELNPRNEENVFNCVENEIFQQIIIIIIIVLPLRLSPEGHSSWKR